LLTIPPVCGRKLPKCRITWALERKKIEKTSRLENGSNIDIEGLA
jgi:hypothetical protein